MTTPGTVPTQLRLTDEDKRRIDAIRDRCGLWSRTDAIRMAIDELYARTEGMTPKKNREKYRRDY